MRGCEGGEGQAEPSWKGKVYEFFCVSVERREEPAMLEKRRTSCGSIQFFVCVVFVPPGCAIESICDVVHKLAHALHNTPAGAYSVSSSDSEELANPSQQTLSRIPLYLHVRRSIKQLEIHSWRVGQP